MKKADDCPFCNIEFMEESVIFPNPDLNGSWERQGNVFVINVLAPAMKGHCMVIPRRHVEKLSELQPPEITEFFQTVDMVIEKLKERFEYEAFTVFLLEGAFRSVPHLHVHIVPKMVIASRTSEEKEATKLNSEQRREMVQELRVVLL